MSVPLAIPPTLQSTGTARRWAANMLGSARNKRASKKLTSDDEKELRHLPGQSPLHGPVHIAGTLPRRRRKHMTGAATPQGEGGGPGLTARWKAAHPWVPNEKMEIIDSSRVWECPRRHAAPKGLPIWKTAQLRTRLMEPGDPLPRHKTRKALLHDLHKGFHAHSSYDLDGDGVVSITDYKLAKDMDTDGSGHIDGEETRLGRIKLARNFFELKNVVTSQYHRCNWKELDHKASDLVKDKNFGRSLRKLKQNLVKRQARGGRDVIDSLTSPGPELTSARYGLGSTQMIKSKSIAVMKRKRKEDFIRDAKASCFPDSFFFQPEVRYGRQSLLTDMKLVNHVHLNGDVLREFKKTAHKAGAPEETSRETSRGTARESARGTARGTARGAARGTARGTARETARESTRETARGTARDSTRDTARKHMFGATN